MTTKPAIQVRDVKKQFLYSRHRNNSLKRAITQIFKQKDRGKESFFALDGISFDVEKGDFFGILGRNGSGKSTLLKIISEIYQPTSGTVKHDGKLVSFIELGVGFKSELTGRENVYLNASLLGFSKDEITEMYDDIVEFAELENFMDQQLKNYSSGMKVRLAFSVAIRSDADILILDEVLAVGDAAFQRKCNEYFTTLKEGKKTVVLVTHSMSNVRDYCNKAIVIDGGKIIYSGETERATDEYLKLFNIESKKKDKDKEKKEDPDDNLDKKVIIDSVKAYHTSKKIEVEIMLHSDVGQKDVKLAVRILNNRKRTVIGANTQSIEHPTTLDFTTSSSKKVKFVLDNILGNGEFSVNVVTGPVVVTGIYHDRIDDTAGFINSRPEGHYPVVAPAIMEVYDNDN